MPPAAAKPARNVRPHKGRSLLAAVDDYVVIDIETTGLAPLFSEIIELGAVRVVNGVVTARFETLVRPAGVISAFITDLTGITNAMVQTAPEITLALPRYLDFIGDGIMIGHNVHFDVNFIYDHCQRWLNRPFPNDFIDTMRLSRRLYQGVKGHRLSNLVRRFGIGGTVEHRALSDVLKTQQCYEYMKTRALGDAALRRLLCDQKQAAAAKQLLLPM